MFDGWLEESLGDPSALLHLAADNLINERMAGCRKLRLAAGWADCHGAPDDHAVAGRQSLLVDRYVRVGGIGTPLVLESCPAELAVVLNTSVPASRQLIGDAVTIRHRLPMLWLRVLAGQVWAWKARQIAQRTSHLSEVSSRIVDRLTSPHVEQLAWGRFERCLDATLLQVDEATYQARAEHAAARRDARLSRDADGLAVLVARLDAGDATAFMALVERVAECLAEDGDEDPVAVRRSKAFGIIAHQARLRDLLARHADQPDDPRHPDQRVAAHADDPTDPWAADDLPAAGWETAAQGNYHQPGFDDLDDLTDSHTSQTPHPDWDGTEGELPVDDADRAWYQQQRDKDAEATSPDDADHADHDHPAAADGEPATDSTAAAEHAEQAEHEQQPDIADHGDDGEAADSRETPAASAPAADTDAPTEQPARTPVPAAFDRAAAVADRDEQPWHCSGCACGSTFDFRPMSRAELNASRTRAVVHVHVTDQTLINQHGVLRTEHGPITLDQFRRWLTDADPNITIRPVLDPASVAAADSYEIQASIREAMQTRQPGSVWPYSPATSITTGGRLDLDHTIPYQPGGPPGQTRLGNLGPLTRAEHRAKTHAGWHVRQPDLGTYVWESPHHWISIVSNQGTLLLGDSPFAHQVWQAAQPQEVAC